MYKILVFIVSATYTRENKGRGKEWGVFSRELRQTLILLLLVIILVTATKDMLAQDEGTKKLLWQGVITTVVKEKAVKRDGQIPNQIKNMMKQFPIQVKK